MNYSIELLIAPIITLFIVQSIKLATDGIKGNFNLKGFFTAYGGMPSSHSAVVISIASMVAYREGIESTTFAIAATFASIVIIDAMVLRGYIDKQDTAINAIMKEHKSDISSYTPTNLRHSFLQVIVGGIIGFGIASIIQLLI